MYLKDVSIIHLKIIDVSIMLAIVSAVREGNIHKHIEAEREMLSLTFAFNRQNYSCNCSYQHIFLQSMGSENKQAFEQFSEWGFGASLSRERFTSMDGD